MSDNQPTPTVSAEEMRVLLEALGAEEIGIPSEKSDVFKLFGWMAHIDYWVSGGSKEPAFIFRCLRFMESDEARKACYVNSFNQEDHENGRDEPAHFVMRKGESSHVVMFTGPLETRIVRAACAVAAEVKRAKESQGK
jgi:hypothetical protein